MAGNGTLEQRLIEAAMQERKSLQPPLNPLEIKPTDSPIIKELKTLKAKKRAPVPTNLLQIIKSLGGINVKELADIMGESKLVNASYKRKAFNTTSRFSLEDHITDGSLDEFLPPNLRSNNYVNKGQDFDVTEARNFIADTLASGTKNILPYDVTEEIKNNAQYKHYEGSANADIESIAELYTDNEINALLREAGYDVREETINAQEFKDNQNDEPQPTSTQNSNQSTIEKPITQSADSNIASGQGAQSGNDPQPKTVTPSPTSDERQDVRQL